MASTTAAAQAAVRISAMTSLRTVHRSAACVAAEELCWFEGGRPGAQAHQAVMLLHVQQGATVSSAPFPEAIQARLAAWRSLRVPEALIALGSRPMLLGRKP